MTRPCLAAITLDAKGGGVAVVSRLLWRVFSDRWGDHSRLITLLEGSGPLSLLGAQALYFAAPVVEPFGSASSLLAWAELLEDPQAVQTLANRLRGQAAGRKEAG